MKKNNKAINLNYITENGQTYVKAPQSLERAVRQQQATRTFKRVLAASATATVKYIDRAFADIQDHDEHTTKHMDAWRASWGIELTEQQARDRLRNLKGQYV